MPAKPIIISYHAVSETWPSALAIRTGVLAEQLERLAGAGFVGFTLSEAERRRVAGTLPERSVVVTFDDGYKSTLQAKPVLDRFGFPGTVFVVTDFIGSDERMVWSGIERWSLSHHAHELRAMTWHELEALVGAGWEVGSHTATHPLLTVLPPGTMESELVRSREAIIERLGRCTSLAYPYGVSDPRVEEAAARAGYDVACTLSFSHSRDEPYVRPRLELTTKDRGLRLMLQLNLIRPFRRTRGALLLRKLRLGEHWLQDSSGTFLSEPPVDATGVPGMPAAGTSDAGQPRSWLAEEAPEVAVAIASNLRVLHDVRAPGRTGGGDVDCAVSGRDDSWPLRLGDAWRVCQHLRYDIGSSYWVIERRRDDLLFAVDLVDDRRGLGQYGFPTSLVFEAKEDRQASPAPLVDPAVGAAYVATKRIRKGIADAGEWHRVRGLARTDSHVFTAALVRVFGKKNGKTIASAVLDHGLPTAAVRTRARRVLRIRRFRTPVRAALIGAAQMRRVAIRITQPTGLVVVIVGPDGTGKSTLAAALPREVAKAFRHTAHFHFRPGVLPRPGALARRPVRDSTKPQGMEPHGAAMSCLLLLYHWLDAVLGSWIRLEPLRVTSGLAVVERGWWDVLIDRRRYRLQAPDVLVHFLGAFVPRPDLLLVLRADPDVILERSGELTREEVVRQLGRWEDFAPRRVPTARLDAGTGEADLLRQARESVLETLEDRCMEGVAGGWVAFPSSTRPRLLIPRSPRLTALRALAVYNPHTKKARLAWRVARPIAATGAFRFFPRGVAPPVEVRHAVASYIPAGGTYSVAESTHAGRFTALVFGPSGDMTAFMKIATNERGRHALEHEAAALAEVTERLPHPLRAPRMLDARDGLLVMEPIHWRPRKDPVRLTPEVARALGRFFRAGATQRGGELTGPAHGDCAPWNLLRGDDGWLLVDWEAYWDAAPPFFDLFHHVVQTHATLGRPELTGVADGFPGSGWLADAVAAYAEGAEIPVSEAPGYFRGYLRAGQEDARLMELLGPSAVNVRRRLLEAWDGR